MINDVNRVFTLGTPVGIQLNYNLYKYNLEKIIHFIGDKDFLKDIMFWKHTPTDSEWIIRFPDEGHCSIHNNAEYNGVADIISYFNQKDSSHVFLDKNNTMHIWSFCKKEIPKHFIRQIGNIDEIKVCNGVHDDRIEFLKKKASYNRNITFIENICNFFVMRKAFKQKIKNINYERKKINVYGRKLTTELKQLDEEINQMKIKVKLFEKEINSKVNQLIKKYKIKAEKCIEPLATCVQISNKKELTNYELSKIINLLEQSSKNFNKFIDYNKTILPNHKNLKKIGG